MGLTIAEIFFKKKLVFSQINYNFWYILKKKKIFLSYEGVMIVEVLLERNWYYRRFYDVRSQSIFVLKGFPV